MRRLVSAEQWAAIRALREDAPPTFSALAAATGINHATLRERAAREGWKTQPFQSAAQRTARMKLLDGCRDNPRDMLAWAEGRADALALLAAGGGGVGRDGGGTGPVAAGADPGEAGAVAGVEGAALGERLERLAGLLARQVDRIVDRAEATGARLDRQGIDEVAALLKLSERALSLAAGGRGADDATETRSDDELAEMLRCLDDRVVELAALHAEWLVAARGRARDRAGD